MSFTRPFIPPVYGTMEIVENTMISVVWAYGPEEYSPQLQYHKDRDSKYIKFNSASALKNYSFILFMFIHALFNSLF
jgi:hypothetical protein